jgi:hypothetical protein
MLTGTIRTLWVLVLIACPTAIVVLGAIYGRNSPYWAEPGWPGAIPGGWNPPLPWPSRAVDVLMVAHSALSVIASIALCWTARGGRARLLVLGGIGLLWVVAAFCWLDASMSTTGAYF